MPAFDMPPAEVEVTEETVRRLLSRQRPDLVGARIDVLAFGWDNLSFRIGLDLVARFPRRAVAVDLLDNEATWLPGLAAMLPLPIPAPVFVGEPGEGYPWHWSLVPFIPGDPAIPGRFDEDRCAAQLGEFLRALHRAAPGEAPANPHRGTSLVERDPAFRARLESLRDTVDSPTLMELWDRALHSPPFQGPAVWLHGDLHPLNLLVADGSLSGVIDFGDLTAGDPATDLAVGWMLFDEKRRGLLRSTYGAGHDSTWARARGWALSLGLAYLAHSADNPVMGAIGERTLAAVAAQE